MSDIAELLERVTKATGPDRSLDGRIAWALGWRFNGFVWSGDPVGGPETAKDFDDWPTMGGGWHLPGDRFRTMYDQEDDSRWLEPPKWTGSIDDTVALVEREFPGWAWKLVHEEGRFIFVLRNAAKLEVVSAAWVNSGPDPALAILAAFLRAKFAPEPQTP